MRIKESRTFARQELDTLLARLPFYRDVHAQDAWQFELLLQLTRCIELDPHEIIMRKGEQGYALFFLLKGQLGVYLDDALQPVTVITPGESFGDLALVTNSERRATVRALGDKGALLVSMDFRPFMNLQEFTTLNLRTKLTFYRQLVHSIRWRLESARMKQPQHDVFSALRQVKPYGGARDTIDELIALGGQARALGEILLKWNELSGAADNLLVSKPSAL